MWVRLRVSRLRRIWLRLRQADRLRLRLLLKLRRLLNPHRPRLLHPNPAAPWAVMAMKNISFSAGEHG
ncbi:MAG: hypothetical protein ACYDIC_07990 [Desulfobaccales bacterium]